MCGSDLHLYEVLAPFMTQGDVLGHEPMGIVEAVGSGVANLAVGDRVVIPFNIACGQCFMCSHGLPTQCETTQVQGARHGRQLFGYTKLYGQVPGGQAEYLRVPQAQYGPIKVPEGPPDDRFVYLSDVLPTACRPSSTPASPGGSLVVLGLGPIGDMACRIARHRGVEQMIGVDLVPERLDRAGRNGVEVSTSSRRGTSNLVDTMREMTDGRGPDAVIDAVGMEAHGSKRATTPQDDDALPDGGREADDRAGVDRLAALHIRHRCRPPRRDDLALGVYGGMTDPLPMMTLFDKQVQLRMGQANVRRWVDDILPLVTVTTTRSGGGLRHAPPPARGGTGAYENFQEKKDGAIKVLFRP